MDCLLLTGGKRKRGQVPNSSDSDDSSVDEGECACMFGVSYAEIVFY